MTDKELKKYIQENPEQYNDRKHKFLFTEEEIVNLSNSLRR